MLLKQGEKIAFCGVLCALSTVFVVGAGLFPTMTYALPAIAGVLLVAAVMELGKKWAFFSYVVVGLLSLLLGTDKEASCFFCLFFGYYPTLKSLLDPLRNRVVQWLLKLLVFNAAAVVLYLTAIYLLGLPPESFSVAGIPAEWLLLLAGNAVFVFYDKAVGGVAFFYWNRLHPAVARIFRK